MASVSEVINYCQHALEKYPNDEQKILKCIDKLFHLDVTVQHLQETGIGRTVNALRKEPGDVGQASRALVYKWKVMVAAEESDQEGDHRNDTSNYNGHISERDSEDSASKPKNRNDHYVKSSKSSKSSNDDQKYKHLNGDSSGSKRRYQYSEEQEPELKKPKHSRSSDDRHKSKQIKNEPSESETQDSDISQTDDNESDTSQSSEENRSERNKVKEEKVEGHKSSYSSKHTSHHGHKSHSVPEKVPESSERNSKHKSGSRKSEQLLSLEKSNDSHKQSSSKDKENNSRKSVKSDQKTKENEKKSDESSSKHSNKKEHLSNTDKHKGHSEKHSNTSEKHKTSNEKTEKVKAKSSSSKDTSSDRHKSRESSSSKHSSSTKDKTNQKHISSKESNHSSKTDKKQLSDSSSKYLRNDEIVKDKKDRERNSDRKKKHSSSSSKSSKSSSSKKTDDTPKKTMQISNSEDSDDGIDCGSGASFAEALGMISPPKPKKKSTTPKDNNSPNNFADLSPASLLAPTAKLAPLPAIEISALPEISPNYKPRPPPKLLPHFTDEDAMNHVISSKNQRTKVYSGNKVLGKIPTLYEMCVTVLQEHIDALEYTGGVPYEILKPVVDKATPQQLFVLEHYNAYLMEETDHLWQKFCEKHFRNKQRREMETWREMYMRCQEEQEHRLKSLTANIRIAQEAKKAPIKQTKMAYVDTIVKPPRNVLRKQALHGTAHASTASPAARVASLAAAPNVLRGGSVRPPPAAPVSTSAFNKPKKAPLMQKALQFFRGRKR